MSNELDVVKSNPLEDIFTKGEEVVGGRGAFNESFIAAGAVVADGRGTY